MNGIHPETIKHRFIHCPQARIIWEFLETAIGRHISDSEKLFGSNEINPFEDAFLALGQFTIWHHRNLVIHRQSEDTLKGNPSPNHALNMLKQKIKTFLTDTSFWISLLNNNNSSIYDPQKAIAMRKALSSIGTDRIPINPERMDDSIPEGT